MFWLFGEDVFFYYVKLFEGLVLLIKVVGEDWVCCVVVNLNVDVEEIFRCFFF